MAMHGQRRSRILTVGVLVAMLAGALGLWLVPGVSADTQARGPYPGATGSYGPGEYYLWTGTVRHGETAFGTVNGFLVGTGTKVVSFRWRCGSTDYARDYVHSNFYAMLPGQAPSMTLASWGGGDRVCGLVLSVEQGHTQIVGSEVSMRWNSDDDWYVNPSPPPSPVPTTTPSVDPSMSPSVCFESAPPSGAPSGYVLQPSACPTPSPSSSPSPAVHWECDNNNSPNNYRACVDTYEVYIPLNGHVVINWEIHDYSSDGNIGGRKEHAGFCQGLSWSTPSSGLDGTQYHDVASTTCYGGYGFPIEGTGGSGYSAGDLAYSGVSNTSGTMTGDVTGGAFVGVLNGHTGWPSGIEEPGSGAQSGVAFDGNPFQFWCGEGDFYYGPVCTAEIHTYDSTGAETDPNDPTAAALPSPSASASGSAAPSSSPLVCYYYNAEKDAYLAGPCPSGGNGGTGTVGGASAPPGVPGTGGSGGSGDGGDCVPGPLSGLCKPGLGVYGNGGDCAYPDGSLNPLDYFGWIGCLVATIPVALANLGQWIINAFLDLFIPSAATTDAIGTFLETLSATFPFSIFGDVLASLDGGGGSVGSLPDIPIMGGGSVPFPTSEISSVVGPYRDIFAAGIYLVIGLGLVRWLLAAVGISKGGGGDAD